MNRPIVRLFGLIAVLFALLIAFTSRWTVFQAASLRSNVKNRRTQLAQQRIPRGEILASNGAVIARSVRTAAGVYERTYPMGSLFAQPVGFSYANAGSAGVEAYRNGALTGQSSVGLQRVLDELKGVSPAGDTVKTTLQPRIQRAALSALGGHQGAVVALAPQTGAVEAMASSPTFNPNEMRSSEGAARVNKAAGATLVNLATGYGYPPGSTFKLVTATAAINSGLFTPQSMISGRNGILISGKPLHNDESASYGMITLKFALAQSVDTAYAQVAEKVGKPTMQRYMERFGFYAQPQLDFPSSQMTPSGEYFENQLTPATSELVDVGRMGIGQDHLKVTPLQMAEVVAAIANGGKLMVPHITSQIIDPEGRIVERIAPRVQSVVMQPSTAAAVTTMMEAVVNEGTGQAVQIPGIQVAGKTGTAEIGQGEINDAWFVAFAPASKPKIAVAAAVANVPGYGAQYALPVVKQVLEAALK